MYTASINQTQNINTVNYLTDILLYIIYNNIITKQKVFMFLERNSESRI